MQAVILVGGLGTRLRPLTSNRPKPMIPLVNQSFIEQMLGNLRDQGITEAILAVQYLADQFRAALGDGSRLGMSVQIVEEPEPRGTAGAVKQVAHLLKGTTFVFNGDVLTDLDLQKMLAFHRAKSSKLTIALTPVEDPTSFGLVETNEDGRIRRFLEKPRADEVTTNMINAGTYILEPDVFQHVPADTFWMFERGLFPDMLRHGEPMYGYPDDSYWTDIGKPHTYLEVHHDILMGKVRYQFRGTEMSHRVWHGEGVQIDPSAQVKGPVVLGDGVVVQAGARITGPTVIGANCQIGPDAQIEGAVLWEGVHVQAGAIIERAVVGRGATIGPKAHVDDGAILGDDVVVGAENRLSRGIRVWPGVTLAEKSITF